MCVGSRAVAGGSLQECLSVRHLGLDHDQTRSGTQLMHAESGAKKSSLTSQRPDGPPMADPTPSIRMAPPDGAGNPIPERFLLGLAPKKSAPLAPARAKGPPQPTARKGRLWVSIAGR